MTAEEYIRAGQVSEALEALQQSVRKNPADSKLRIFLFQLQSISGAWQKALTQLNVLSDMDIESAMLAQIFSPVLNLEALRADVFAGKRSPLIFGEPPEWIGKLLQANQLITQGNYAASSELREQAYEEAPSIPWKDQWRALRMDRRRGFSSRAGARGLRGRQILLDSLFPHSNHRHRSADGSARPDLDHGAVCMGERRSGFRFHPDPLLRHRVEPRFRAEAFSQDGMERAGRGNLSWRGTTAFCHGSGGCFPARRAKNRIHARARKLPLPAPLKMPMPKRRQWWKPHPPKGRLDAHSSRPCSNPAKIASSLACSIA